MLKIELIVLLCEKWELQGCTFRIHYQKAVQCCWGDVGAGGSVGALDISQPDSWSVWQQTKPASEDSLHPGVLPGEPRSHGPLLPGGQQVQLLPRQVRGGGERELQQWLGQGGLQLQGSGWQDTPALHWAATRVPLRPLVLQGWQRLRPGALPLHHHAGVAKGRLLQVWASCLSPGIDL